MNCAVLAFAPYFVLFKYSSLSEYCSLWQCCQGAGLYFATQFIKLLTYATFFPAQETFTPSVFQYFIMNVADMYDIVGLWLAISWISGRGVVRFIVAGYSWAFAHSLSTHLLPLIIGARKAVFHWAFIQRGFEANLDLVFFVAMATLVWLNQRHDAALSVNRLSMALLLVGLCRNPLFGILENLWHVQSWSLLSCKAAYSAFFGLSSISAYSQLSAGSPVHTKSS